MTGYSLQLKTCLDFPSRITSALHSARCSSFSGYLQRSHVLLTDVEVIGRPVVRLPYGLPHKQPHGFSVVLQNSQCYDQFT